MDKDQRCPSIVIIHGGGWTGGTKRGAREQNIGTNLAKNGYVCISIDYLLATKEKSTWPQNLHDCKTAVCWLRANAEKYYVDPQAGNAARTAQHPKLTAAVYDRARLSALESIVDRLPPLLPTEPVGPPQSSCHRDRPALYKVCTRS